MRMKQRLEQLETAERAASSGGVYAICLYDGESDGEAVAVYEAEHGPIPESDCLRVFLRKPGRRSEAPCAA